MAGVAEICIHVSGQLGSHAVRLIVVSGANRPRGVRHFADGAQMVSREEVIRAANLLTLAKESLDQGSTGIASLLAKLHAAPKIRVRADRGPVLFLHDLHPPAQTVVGHFRAVGRSPIDGSR